MNDSPNSDVPSPIPDRSARLRRRLVGGAFMTFLAIEGITAGAAQAAVTPKADAAAPATLTARAEGVFASQSAAVPADERPDRAIMWGNGWFNWGNAWHKWMNNWSNWNNWNNAWNNWVNFGNWSNF